MIFRMFAVCAAIALAGCGGGGGNGNGGNPEPATPGKTIDTPAFATYQTDHNGRNRIRRDNSTPQDQAILAKFEDADPTGPAGYRNLLDLTDTIYDDVMTIEVIAKVASDGGMAPAERILRLTVDQTPFTAARAGAPVSADGKYYLRGANFVWASLDGAPLLTGANSDGLVNMELDFGKETASLRLETGVGTGSDVRTEMTATDLPFNIRTGAYGGDVTLTVWDPTGTDILSAAGSLRGAVGGTPEFAGGRHQMTTGGLYTISGKDPVTGRQVDANGVFFGADPNAGE
ncbi:viral aspartic protease [Falsirhodobacter deserti]|uniref:viral aspartic protease n=1 Tax=Falsirhodobacter deserti TaxID=1365611 RepID=UPI001F4D4494|nr:viral aspartic protease [Falsirhodobacter deserti]